MTDLLVPMNMTTDRSAKRIANCARLPAAGIHPRRPATSGKLARAIMAGKSPTQASLVPQRFARTGENTAARGGAGPVSSPSHRIFSAGSRQ
jgi:hypothetical protein